MRPLRIAFVTPYVPSQLRPRPFNFLRGLAARGHRLSLFAVATTAAELDDVAALRPFCERVEVVSQPRARSLWSCAGALGRGAPLQSAYCMSPVMNARLQTVLGEANAPEILHVEHLRAAAYGFDQPARGRIYDAVDCMSRLHSQTAASGPTWSSRATAWVEMAATRRFERAAVARFDRVLLTSERERGALLDLLGDPPLRGAAERRVCSLPNGVDFDHFAPSGLERDPATLIFVGRMGYHANVAAARTLIETVMPMVWAHRPQARLLIVGADPSPALRTLAARAGERVSVTGTVPDVRPFLGRATVSVNPLGYAVGIQNKVLEAMAMATPVVASPAAAAGLGALVDTDLLVAARPAEVAAAALRLLDDPALARRIGEAGRRYVVARHDWAAAAARLEAIYDETLAAPPARAAGVAA